MAATRRPGPPDAFRLPLLLSARLHAWWLLYRVRRSPLAALTAVVAAIVIAGMVTVVVHGPTGGCQWRVVAGRGMRAHYVCEREGQ